MEFCYLGPSYFITSWRSPSCLLSLLLQQVHSQPPMRYDLVGYGLHLQGQTLLHFHHPFWFSFVQIPYRTYVGQLSVSAIGFIHFSQLHPGSRYVLPIVTPLSRVVISALPLSNERVSSGEFILFFCIFVVVPNSIYRCPYFWLPYWTPFWWATLIDSDHLCHYTTTYTRMFRHAARIISRCRFRSKTSNQANNSRRWPISLACYLL